MLTRPSSSTPRSSDRTRPAATRSGTTTSTRPTRSVPSSGCATREEEAALHPLAAGAVRMPVIGAPEDERERRQLRATYYGAQREVDDGLAPLFGYLERSGLAASTLVVVTSDHGEMGCDHWLLEKLGFWDESYRVPLIVVDPRPEADGGRGRVVDAVTESVDVLPTICEFIGAEVPLQADGWPLTPFLLGGAAPEHWRDTAHFEWSFSDPVNQLPEQAFGIPMSHCALAVSRGSRHKYVQFAADAELFPPLLFDLETDPGQTRNLLAEGGSGRSASWPGGRPRTAPVADAHLGADTQWQLPRRTSGAWSKPATTGAEPPSARLRSQAVCEAEPALRHRGGWPRCPTCMARRSSLPAAIPGSGSRPPPSLPPWAHGSCSTARNADKGRAAVAAVASGWGRTAPCSSSCSTWPTWDRCAVVRPRSWSRRPGSTSSSTTPASC